MEQAHAPLRAAFKYDRHNVMNLLPFETRVGLAILLMVHGADIKSLRKHEVEKFIHFFCAIFFYQESLKFLLGGRDCR